MKVKKIGIVAIMLLFGTTNLLFSQESNQTSNKKYVAVEKSIAKGSSNVTEDEIMKALGAIKTVEVMKASDPRIVSESKPMILLSDKPKIQKKHKVQKKHKTHQKRKIRRKKRIQQAVDMEDLPMAKSYPMSYDVSQITE